MSGTPMADVPRKKDWEPTEAAFRRLLNWLDGAVDSFGQRYVEMRRRLVQYFDRKGCSMPDELADNTLNRVARRLEEEGQIVDAAPAQYCYIMAKFVFLEFLREPQSKDLRSSAAHGSPYAVSGLSDTESKIKDNETEKMLDSLEECLAELPPADRNLILDYYQGAQKEKLENRRRLAAHLGLTANALSIRACRLRDKLETCRQKTNAAS